MVNITQSSIRKFDNFTREDFLKWDEESRNNNFGGLNFVFDQEIEDQIVTPHKRERPNDAIVWLVWKWNEDEEYSGIPQLACICTNEYSIRYHVGMLISQQKMHLENVKVGSDHYLTMDRMRFVVERTPLDHMFGSEMLLEAQKRYIFNKPIKIVEARKFEFGGEED